MTEYERVMAHIRDRIASGEWGPGFAIPSTARLATDLGVSASTIGKAVLALRLTGELVSRKGSGVFVAAPRQG